MNKNNPCVFYLTIILQFMWYSKLTLRIHVFIPAGQGNSSNTMLGNAAHTTVGGHTTLPVLALRRPSNWKVKFSLYVTWFPREGVTSRSVATLSLVELSIYHV